MIEKEKFYEYKVIKNKGARIHLIRIQGEPYWKFHRWDGPAIHPINKICEHKKEYYLHGIQYDFEEYDAIMKGREGLPHYKNPSFKGERF